MSAGHSPDICPWACCPRERACVRVRVFTEHQYTCDGCFLDGNSDRDLFWRLGGDRQNSEIPRYSPKIPKRFIPNR